MHPNYKSCSRAKLVTFGLEIDTSIWKFVFFSLSYCSLTWCFEQGGSSSASSPPFSPSSSMEWWFSSFFCCSPKRAINWFWLMLNCLFNLLFSSERKKRTLQMRIMSVRISLSIAHLQHREPYQPILLHVDLVQGHCLKTKMSKYVKWRNFERLKMLNMLNTWWLSWQSTDLKNSIYRIKDVKGMIWPRTLCKIVNESKYCWQCNDTIDEAPLTSSKTEVRPNVKGHDSEKNHIILMSWKSVGTLYELWHCHLAVTCYL